MWLPKNERRLTLTLEPILRAMEDSNSRFARYGGKFRRVLGLCLIFLSLLRGVSCSDNEDDPEKDYYLAETPVFELKTATDMGSIATSENMLVGAGQNGFLYLWEWVDLNREPQKTPVDSWLPVREYATSRIPPLNRVCTLVSPKRVVYASQKKDNTSIVVRSIKAEREHNRWVLEKQWRCQQVRNTRNAEFAALTLSNIFDFIYGDTKLPTAYRFGVLNSQTSTINWVTTVYQHDSLPKVSAISVSEDGKYLAAVGTDNGGWILLADVEGRKVLWQKVPHGDEVPHGIWTVNFNDVCFSPDSKYIYVAGNCGLFCFDVATGKILSQWQIGGRFVSVDVSPDGRLVAGGTEISGFVYIYNAKTGKMLLKLLTGQFSIYGLAFSPDSTLLATSGVMNTNVKIWKMPSPASEAKSEVK